MYTYNRHEIRMKMINDRTGCEQAAVIIVRGLIDGMKQGGAFEAYPLDNDVLDLVREITRIIEHYSSSDYEKEQRQIANKFVKIAKRLEYKFSKKGS